MKNTLKTRNDDNLKKVCWTFFIVLLGFAVYFRVVDHGWEGIVQSDGKGYFGYLPAIFVYHDLNFEYFTNGKLEMPYDYFWSWLYYFGEERAIKYTAGVAFMQSPFFLLATLISWIFGFEMNGYSFFFQLFVLISAITYACLSFHFLKKTIETFNDNKFVSTFISGSMLFSTNLLNYTINEPSMSHIYTYFAFTMVLFQFRKFILTDNSKHLYLFAFFYGASVLIRPTNGIMILALPYLCYNNETFLAFIRSIGPKILLFFKAVLIALVIIFIQSALWYLQAGKFYLWTYVDETFNWFTPNLFNVLWSYKKGLFVYTPFILFIIPSLLFFILRKDWFKFVTAGLMLLPAWYVVSSWWCWYYGDSFGLRAFIDYYPFIAIVMLPFFIWLTEKCTNKILILIFSLFTSLNFIQNYQYINHIIHYDSMDKSKFWEVFLGVTKNYQWKAWYNENAEPPVEIEGKIIRKFFMDFDECPENWIDCTWKYDDNSLSRNQLLVLDSSRLISPRLSIDFGFGPEEKVYLKSNIWIFKPNKSSNLNLVMDLLDSENKGILQVKERIKFDEVEKSKNDWNMYQINFPIPYRQNLHRMEVYIQYESKELVKLDDFAIFIHR